MSEPKTQSPALGVLVSVLIILLIVAVLAWPAPRLCYEQLTGTPAVSDVCNPLSWVRRAIARVLGG
ncbi:MAG: hypothetical protein HS104_33700 [Polyangiaceae bacterium]|nr:hypothetical protein [Polyangiaceae bacterium]MCE7893747.1 hypothetical protein [Sorangiineae bacterium PRO1]MCL4755413.1 hypothetical protein [Myxococcales bacterium]